MQALRRAVQPCGRLAVARTLATAQRARAEPVYVVGVGMTKFEKPGKSGLDYPAMAKEAGMRALADAGVPLSEVQAAMVSYVYGESTSGNRAVYELGLTGIPIVNCNNNCSSGSTALYLARQHIAGGLHDCVLALGFEKMQRGSLAFGDSDRESPITRHLTHCANLAGGMPEKAPPAPFMFAAAGLEHMKLYGTKPEHFGMIAQKNHAHSVNNPYAQFQTEYTLEEVMGSPAVTPPLTRLQCSPTSDGAGAAILASKSFVERHNLQAQAVEIAGMAMATDMANSFEDSLANTIGADMTRRAREQALAQAGVAPEEIDVIELHDCFSCNELITYEGLGLCGTGQGAQLIESGNATYGGKYVINPSGGLISKGHPLGATGLAQCAELCWQLRGEAGKRQVANAKVALQHNLGLGGAAVVTVYTK